MSCHYWNTCPVCPKCRKKTEELFVMESWNIYYCEACDLVIEPNIKEV